MGFVSCPRNKKTLKLGQKKKCPTNHCCFGFFGSIITLDKLCGWGVQLIVDTGKWLLNKDRCGIFLLMRRRSQREYYMVKSLPQPQHVFWSHCSQPVNRELSVLCCCPRFALTLCSGISQDLSECKDKIFFLAISTGSYKILSHFPKWWKPWSSECETDLLNLNMKAIPKG